jgi:hypothetical protein
MLLQSGAFIESSQDSIRKVLFSFKGTAPGRSLVGALVLSRAIDDPKLSDEILEAAAATFGRAPRSWSD